MMRISIVVTILIAIFSIADADCYELTPAFILMELETKLPGDVVSEIWRSDELAKQLIAGVSSARPDWINAAQKLSAGTDVSVSDALDDALALALLKSPYQVLPWLKEKWWYGTRQVCRFGFDDDLPGGLGSYIEQLKIALLQSPPENFRPLRDACLMGLKNY
jgi:hypothetical protein